MIFLLSAVKNSEGEKNSCSSSTFISPCRQSFAMVLGIVDVSSTRGSLAIVVDCQHILEESAKGGNAWERS